MVRRRDPRCGRRLRRSYHGLIRASPTASASAGQVLEGGCLLGTLVPSHQVRFAGDCLSLRRYCRIAEGSSRLSGYAEIADCPPHAVTVLAGHVGVRGQRRADRRDRGRRGGDPPGPDRLAGRRAGGGRLPAWYARQHRLHVRGPQALLRRHLLPVPGGYPAASLRPVRARRLGHRRGGARGGVDRHRPAVAEGQSAGLHHRAAPSKQDLEACWELGALLAAEVAGYT